MMTGKRPSPAVTQLLEKIITVIETEPKRLDMNVVAVTKSGTKEGTRTADYFPACGTVGCIAGWAYMLATPDDVQVRIPKTNFMASVRAVLSGAGILQKAAQILEIETSYHELFFVEHWPRVYRDAYRVNHLDRTERAEITVKRIRHFIKTGY